MGSLFKSKAQASLTEGKNMIQNAIDPEPEQPKEKTYWEQFKEGVSDAGTSIKTAVQGEPKSARMQEAEKRIKENRENRERSRQKYNTKK
jgi:hypothetical protein